MAKFLDLQNGWYNGFIQGMGQNKDSFQILEPAPPLVKGAGANKTLWDYFNNLPPFSLVQNIGSGGAQFYNNYRGLLSALEPTRTVDVKKNIGDANFTAWQKYVSGLSVPPTINQLPTLFRSWAMLNAPSVANKGASDYAAILLDPIAAAQTEMTLIYTDANGQAKPYDWQLTFDQMKTSLAQAPSRTFTFNSSSMDSNVSKSWAGSQHEGLFGLWGGSSSSSSVTTKFATSKVTITASFDHVMPFADTPGNWYSSAAMGLAYSNKTGNPWSSASSIDWNNTFGTNGIMQRFMANVLVASGMKVTVTSDATYSTSEQVDIQNNQHAGFWPFYCESSSDGSSYNNATFKGGKMTITMTSKTGVPIVLGGNVLGAGDFTGHSSEAANMMVNALQVAEAY